MATNLISKINIGNNNYDINAIHYTTGTGTAAVTTSPYNFAKWDCTINSVTELYDGLTVVYKVPVAGNGSYGTGFQINNLGYHPVVRTTNAMISTRYAVNANILMVYVSNISGTWYNNSASSSTKTGCWVVVNDSDSNDYAQASQLKLGNASLYKSYTVCGRYMFLLSKDEEYLLPTTTENNSTSTTKTITTQTFDPFKPIYYYAGTSTTQNPANYVFPADILYT